MSAWRHNICADCWHEREGNRVPTQVVYLHPTGKVCCFCGRDTWDSVLIRRDPKLTPCRGEGESHPKEVESTSA